jgi:hypothetical protein
VRSGSGSEPILSGFIGLALRLREEESFSSRVSAGPDGGLECPRVDGSEGASKETGRGGGSGKLIGSIKGFSRKT